MNIKGKATFEITLPDLRTNEDVTIRVGDELELRDIRDLGDMIAYAVYCNDGESCLMFTKRVLEKCTTIRV